MGCISLKSADLAGLDAVDFESIGLFCWADVRPLVGVAGYIDWRLCGALSRTLLNQQFVGQLHESMLMPVQSRLSFKRIFVFGLGASADYSTALAKQAIKRALSSLGEAGVDSVCVGLPSHRRAPEKTMDFYGLLEQRWSDDVDLILADPAFVSELR